MSTTNDDMNGGEPSSLSAERGAEIVGGISGKPNLPVRGHARKPILPGDGAPHLVAPDLNSPVADIVRGLTRYEHDRLVPAGGDVRQVRLKAPDAPPVQDRIEVGARHLGRAAQDADRRVAGEQPVPGERVRKTEPGRPARVEAAGGAVLRLELREIPGDERA